jgi:hypothetical protein
MTREEAAAKLRDFIAAYAEGNDDVDGMIVAVEGSIRRFVEGRSNPDVRAQAEALAKAARAYRQAARAYRAAVTESGFVWPWLLSGKGGLDAWGPILSRVQKAEKAKEIEEAEGVENAALALAVRLKTGKKPPDMLRSALLYELAEYFRIITCSTAKSSRGANFIQNKPGTKFGYFVQLALSASADASTAKVKSLMSAPAAFLRDAAKSAKARDSKGSPLGTNVRAGRIISPL